MPPGDRRLFPLAKEDSAGLLEAPVRELRSKKTDLRRGKVRGSCNLSHGASPAPGSGMEDAAEDILFGRGADSPEDGTSEENDGGQQGR
jgi:hypothetical protein